MLQQDIEKSVAVLQDIVDSEVGDSVKIFDSRAKSNNSWLKDLDSKFGLKEADELGYLETVKIENFEKLDEIRQKIDYYEGLLNELEEAQKELEVKSKVISKKK
ncbi:Biogenesis of lysosome-related organelles complex 1 subunit BLI1 [Nakaseomyces bracarensis]|uniref:Biogenesis of lysosome-related organelles complex 1 subunit BLI1 n=1 Tax=Nakaseomyces bracarensis TaxID=273131 RepID=A0ABR4NQW9_9SACH